jgi:DNA-binding MarR family transcriptional regulator
VLTQASLHDDPVLPILLTSQILGADVLERVRAADHPELRSSHGFIFQVLIPGPVSIGEIAGALGVTSQAVSQSVAELERLGYVARRRSDDDGRRRLVALTTKGRDAVDAGRRARTEISREIARAIGRDRARELAAALADVLEARGAMDTIRTRRVRPVP